MHISVCFRIIAYLCTYGEINFAEDSRVEYPRCEAMFCDFLMVAEMFGILGNVRKNWLTAKGRYGKMYQNEETLLMRS